MNAPNIYCLSDGANWRYRPVLLATSLMHPSRPGLESAVETSLLKGGPVKHSNYAHYAAAWELVFHLSPDPIVF